MRQGFEVEIRTLSTRQKIVARGADILKVFYTYTPKRARNSFFN